MRACVANSRDRNARGEPVRSPLVRCGTIVILVSLLYPAGARTQERAGEYQLKAAFLFNFGKFIEWPESSFAGTTSPFLVCVLGEDPFGKTLDQTLQGKQMANHPVRIVRAMDANGVRQCQIVFVSASEKPHLPAIFAALRGSNALIVGETSGFAASGGAIEFTMEEKHIHFTINLDAIQRAGLQISSQLLALARVVHDGRNYGNG